jgi:hypothetical protein
MSGSINKVFGHRRFFHYNLEAIKTITSDGNVNLFVNPFLGGLGFNLHPEIRPHVSFTNFQKRLGGYLLSILRGYKVPEGKELEASKSFFRRVLRLTDPNQRARPKSLLERFHFGRYVVMPSVGPMESHMRDILDYSYPTPMMSDDDVEKAPLEISSIPSAILRAVRLESKEGTNCFSLRTKVSKLLSFPWKVVELVSNVSESIPKEFPDPFDLDFYRSN